MLKINRRQHSVGQGFFHSASIDFRGIYLHYVYDCGSENIEPLKREIMNYTSVLDKDIDILFLSHLDNDHVNGLDQLLSGTRAEMVVLPYLSVFERILLAAKAVENGTISADYIQFIGNPTEWLSRRNVARIIFVHAPAEEDAEDLGSPTNESIFGNEYPIEPPIGLALKVLEPHRVTSARKRRKTETFAIPSDTLLPLVSRQDSQLDWCFLTFVHPEKEREQLFRQNIAKLIGMRLPSEGTGTPKPISSWLLENLQQKKKREKLVDCYADIRKDRNLTSMSLYSGPLQPSTISDYSFRVDGHSYKFGGYHQACGWLATGDANLLRERRRAQFLKHYQQVLDNVVTMSLPHHGSKYNFHQSILAPNAEFFYVGAGLHNSYQHPHSEVKEVLMQTGRDLISINEDPDSTFCEYFTVS